ncbi:flagellar export protein FliJ [Paenibacillus sp. IB182496]|uniref:Flagellar FliJ protein n=1 Tax=Paenibacillus sabuli TaxID=2772509 RepID=A0A927BS44_9BACL|nr:flagellar export protein FliJ [Paenibacillus sabuli]MBD2845287.1 flagellar export protein FliJ [Paenibacillus sabuli]
MAAYRYPYQKIVDLKKNEKTQAEWGLAEANAQLSEVDGALQQLRQERLRWYDTLSQAAGRSVSLSELRTYQQYLEHLDQCIARKLEAVREAQAAVAKRQDALALKAKDEKVWQKAREQSLLKFTQFRLTQEQNELDELASVRHAR